MVNVTQMRIKTGMLNGVAKCRGSVTGKPDPVLLSSCSPISILNSVWVFLMAFTSSAFAVTFAFASVENVTSLFLFFTFLSLLSLLLFEKWFSPRGEILRSSVCFSVFAVFNEHIGGHCFCDQGHNGVLLELFRWHLVFFGDLV
jgi:hypothetical protein